MLKCLQPLLWLHTNRSIIDQSSLVSMVLIIGDSERVYARETREIISLARYLGVFLEGGRLAMPYASFATKNQKATRIIKCQ